MKSKKTRIFCAQRSCFLRRTSGSDHGSVSFFAYDACNASGIRCIFVYALDARGTCARKSASGPGENET